jgi:TolA-binding protein
MNKIICILFISLTLNANEVSVFGAGDINSNTPYGLTKSEKAILTNSNKIKRLNDQIVSISSSYDDFNQKLEGIESVYESDSKNLNSVRRDLPNLKNNVLLNTQNIALLSKESESIISNTKKIKELTEKLNQFINLQEENNKRIFQSLLVQKKLINSINNNYITKKQFDELVSFVNKKRTTKQVKKKKISKHIKKRTNSELLKYAIKLFHNNYLTKSKPYFETLVSKHYKPAQSNFYLGEIYYYKRGYKTAIFYYKKSMMKNDQAQYIPKLLLHSAISFDKLNDNENATNFYSTLVDAYPETKEATEALKQLKK